jgi:hypothetical protein
VYKHANGPPSRLARIAGDKRCSKESRGRTSARKLRRVSHHRKIVRSSSLLGSFGLRVSHVLRVHLNSVARGGRGSRASGAYLSRVSVGESRVARCGASSSNLLCIQKRKRRAALRAHRAWQRLQGQPLQRARTALAEFVLVCRTLKISLQKSKGCDWLREASASIRQAGVHGGLAEAIAFANATRYRNGETAQWDGTLAAKPTKAGQARDIGSIPVARGKRRKTEADEMYLSMEVVPDCKAAWSSRIMSTSELGAASMCGPLRRDPQAGTSRRLDRHDSGSTIAPG